MDIEVDLLAKDNAEIQEYLARLGDVTPLLAPLGMIARSHSKEAFELQAFGDIEWPEQYPFSRGPFVHVAGLVRDLNESGTVKPRRLKRGPSNFDTGLLQFSITTTVTGEDSIQVGSALPYARRMQIGGKSSQPITEATRQGLKRFLDDLPGQPKNALARKALSGVNRSAKIAKKLGFLFNDAELETDAAARPFIGVHDVMASDMMDTVKEFLESPA